LEVFDPLDDINKSVAFAFATIRERQATGGPGWKGHDMSDTNQANDEPKVTPLFRGQPSLMEAVRILAENQDRFEKAIMRRLDEMQKRIG